jgi:putative hydrolase of the HAD superfamily
MPVRAVIFDYGKVLSALPDADAHTALVETAGLPDEVFEEHYWAHRHAYDLGELNGHTFWEAVARSAGIVLSPEQVEVLNRHDARMWTNLNQPMVDWASALQRAGIRTAILSNMGDVIHASMQNQFPWLSGFDHLLWSYKLRLAKPDPAIFHHAVRELGVPPQDTLFIDDIPVNIESARSVGLDGILFETVPQLRRELAARGLEGALPFPVD